MDSAIRQLRSRGSAREIRAGGVRRCAMERWFRLIAAVLCLVCWQSATFLSECPLRAERQFLVGRRLVFSPGPAPDFT
jgi:hypothetical protein